MVEADPPSTTRPTLFLLQFKRETAVATFSVLEPYYQKLQARIIEAEEGVKRRAEENQADFLPPQVRGQLVTSMLPAEKKLKVQKLKQQFPAIQHLGREQSGEVFGFLASLPLVGLKVDLLDPYLAFSWLPGAISSPGCSPMQKPDVIKHLALCTHRAIGAFLALPVEEKKGQFGPFPSVEAWRQAMLLCRPEQVTPASWLKLFQGPKPPTLSAYWET